MFCVIGLYLNSSYGLFHRCYGENISISDMDKRIYNSKVFQFKKDSFGEKNDKFRLLVLGNSFGRDFVNIILETYDTKKLDIVYRDDFDDYSVLSSPIGARLFEDANLVVFASSKGNNVKNIIRNNDDKVFYLGTKFFGYNENWIIRLPSSARKNQKNDIGRYKLQEVDNGICRNMAKKNFVSLLKPIVVDNKIPITDENGVLISTDRAHLTKYGAIFFGKKVVAGSEIGKILE